MTKKTTKADVSTISPSTEAFIMHEDSDKELTLTTNCKLLIFTQHSNLTLNHFFDTQFQQMHVNISGSSRGSNDEQKTTFTDEEPADRLTQPSSTNTTVVQITVTLTQTISSLRSNLKTQIPKLSHTKYRQTSCLHWSSFVFCLFELV